MSILALKSLMNNHLFISEWDHWHWQEDFMRKTMIHVVTFLAPSLWMDLSLGIILKSKYDIFGSYPWLAKHTNLWLMDDYFPTLSPPNSFICYQITEHEPNMDIYLETHEPCNFELIRMCQKFVSVEKWSCFWCVGSSQEGVDSNRCLPLDANFAWTSHIFILVKLFKKMFM